MQKLKTIVEISSDEMFDQIEPFDGDVIYSDLLDEITNLIKRFIICDDPVLISAALWIAFTWVIDFVSVAPIAAVRAPEKRCGKTQLLMIFSRLAKRPLASSNISSSALFRSIHKWCPTIIIDEADSFIDSKNEELRGIINSGHTHDTAYVIRTEGEGDNREPKRFSTWSAKAIAGIGNLPETISDRSIILELRRKMPNEKAERLRFSDKREFQIIAQKLAKFVAEKGRLVGETRPRLPEQLNDRAQDNWEPLIAIAAVAGGHWPKTARAAALKISQDAEGVASTNTELLSDIREISKFEGHRDGRIKMAELVGKLISNDEWNWAEYNRGKPLSTRQLSKRLGEFGIRTHQEKTSTGRLRYLRWSDFADVWVRYLEPEKAHESASTPSNFNDLSSVSGVAARELAGESVSTPSTLRNSAQITNKLAVLVAHESDSVREQKIELKHLDSLTVLTNSPESDEASGQRVFLV